MKKLKYLLFSLLLLLIITSLFACKNEQAQGGQKQSGAADGTEWEDVDYSGTLLKISLSVDQDRNKTTLPHSERYIRGSDANLSDTVQNMAYDRNARVEAMIGIAVQYIECHHQYDKVSEYIDELVMAANDGTPDIFIDDVYGAIRSAMNGSLYNVLDQSEKNYFNFTEENGWYIDYMDGLSLDPARVKYILAGDYFIDVLRETFVLFVNIDRYEETFGEEIQFFYDTIKAGDFTYDYFSQMIEVAWAPGPNNRTSKAAVDDDLIGFVIDSIGVYPFLWASNGEGNRLFTKNAQGEYEVLYDNTTYFTFAQDVYDLLTAQPVYITKEDGQSAEKRTSFLFANGNVLFAEGMWLADLEAPEIRDMEQRKGVTVYPKQNGSIATYNTFVHDTAESGSIALSTQKFTECTAYLQCINQQSSGLITEYKEYALKYKYNKDYATIEMIDLIYDTIGSPFETIMSQMAFDMTNTVHGANGINTPKNFMNRYVHSNVPFSFAHDYQTSYNVYVAGLTALKNKFANAN